MKGDQTHDLIISQSPTARYTDKGKLGINTWILVEANIQSIVITIPGTIIEKKIQI